MYSVKCECGKVIKTYAEEFCCHFCGRLGLIRFNEKSMKERFYSLFGEIAIKKSSSSSCKTSS